MTRLLLAGEPLTGGAEDRERLSAWRDALVGLGVLSQEEELEATGQQDDGATGRVIVVVREQLDQLNSLYCRAVLALQTSQDFESFVDAAVASGHHDFSEDLAPLLDAPNTEVVAVPYSRVHPDQPNPGPVLVTAIRILHKRLTRVRLSRGEDTTSEQGAAELVRQQAARNAWDDIAYWGWSAARAAEMTERFSAGNAQFAERVWGTAWPDPPEVHPQTRFDLAGSRPVIVSDVLTTIQQAIYGTLDPQA